ncbi:hypothetical protein V6N13_035069 [Hibiscus sabdariffa]
MTGESESSQIMMVGSSGPSGRPPFDLNLPASGEEGGDDIKRTLYQLELAKVQEQKMELAQRIRPLIEEESLKRNLEELPSETAVVENLITRMAGIRTRAANDPNAEMEEFRYLKTWLTRACQNAEDETKGRMSIRTEIKLIIQKSVQNDRSFLRFGYEVSFEALDKGAIEILGPYECVMTRGRLPGGGGSSVVGKRETRLYEPEERLHSSSKGVKTGAFCSASRNASE